MMHSRPSPGTQDWIRTPTCCIPWARSKRRGFSPEAAARHLHQPRPIKIASFCSLIFPTWAWLFSSWAKAKSNSAWNRVVRLFGGGCCQKKDNFRVFWQDWKFELPASQVNSIFWSCMKIQVRAHLWEHVWYVRGLPWKLVENFGSRFYFSVRSLPSVDLDLSCFAVPHALLPLLILVNSLLILESVWTVLLFDDFRVVSICLYHRIFFVGGGHFHILVPLQQYDGDGGHGH